MMTTGVRVQLGGQNHHFRFEYGAWLSDERALKDVASSKGASGSKCCINCMNVVARRQPRPGDAYHVHFKHVATADFKQHTPQTMKALVEEMKLRMHSLSARAFAVVEQCAGINYNEDAILFSPYHLELTKMPITLYWDWMHCLVASGGVFQYHLNGFAKVQTVLDQVLWFLRIFGPQV